MVVLIMSFCSACRKSSLRLSQVRDKLKDLDDVPALNSKNLRAKSTLYPRLDPKLGFRDSLIPHDVVRYRVYISGIVPRIYAREAVR